MDVIAIIDAGKTNKKFFLFDENYSVIFEHSLQLETDIDEDGDSCERWQDLHRFIMEAIAMVATTEYNIKAINFSAYGASLVYIGESGEPVTFLYDYLKEYPDKLRKKFYSEYGGEETFSVRTASPVLGSLNSGMQLYRLKEERPGLFEKVRYALHLPQYLSYVVTGKPFSDITSIGCHTNLWDFEKGAYHDWVKKEGVDKVLPAIATYDTIVPSKLEGHNFQSGIGLHDSSAALIPYLVNFDEPFALISSGTWCISLNPFNHSPLTVEELRKDCLSYLDYKGNPVKASRLFAGRMHDEGVSRIADHFHVDTEIFKSIQFNPGLCADDDKKEYSQHHNIESAYHQLMNDLVDQQYESTSLVLKNSKVNRIFVDGGFSNNSLFMSMLAARFRGIDVYAASMHQATALGAALALHKTWNSKSFPSDLIKLQLANLK